MKWNLKDLLSDPARDLEGLRKEVDGQVRRFEEFRERLSPDIPSDTFLEALRLADTIARTTSRLGAYAYLWFSENTKDQQARSFKAIVEELQAELANRMLFFDLWWQKLDDTNAGRLLARSGDYAYHLESLRRFREHALSEPEEKIVNVKSVTGRQAVVGLYEILTSGLSYQLKVKGRVHKKLTREDLMVYVRDPDARVREAAYRELFRVYAANADVIGDIYKTLVMDWKQENLGLRKHRSPIGVRNLSNDIPEDAVDALLNVCAANAGVFQHYFKLKARLCRIRKMSRHHIYARFHESDKRYTFAKGSHMVLDAYRGFSP
ncbi:MAG: oligoendopeptidase F, partial [Nitrospirota bacterium]